LQPIIRQDLRNLPGSADAPPDVAKQYISLLMALAYTLQTRLDLAVYVNALQRHALKPCMIHVRRLNAVVRWAQRNPVSLVYDRMTPTNVLEVHSDAGFKREEDEGSSAPSGKSMRGANFMRLGKDANGKERIHVLDWQCGSIKNVTRSTFVSELQAAISAVDNGLMLALTLHELCKGPVTPHQGMCLRENGQTAVKLHVCIDAMSVYSSLASDRIKAPAEKSLLCHLLWIRELIDAGSISEFRWIDTRDMSADGHTKGSIPRTALHDVARGYITRLHPHKALKAKPKIASVVVDQFVTQVASDTFFMQDLHSQCVDVKRTQDCDMRSLQPQPFRRPNSVPPQAPALGDLSVAAHFCSATAANSSSTSECARRRVTAPQAGRGRTRRWASAASACTAQRRPPSGSASPGRTPEGGKGEPSPLGSAHLECTPSGWLRRKRKPSLLGSAHPKCTPSGWLGSASFALVFRGWPLVRSPLDIMSQHHDDRTEEQEAEDEEWRWRQEGDHFRTVNPWEMLELQIPPILMEEDVFTACRQAAKGRRQWSLERHPDKIRRKCLQIGGMTEDDIKEQEALAAAELAAANRAWDVFAQAPARALYHLAAWWRNNPRVARPRTGQAASSSAPKAKPPPDYGPWAQAGVNGPQWAGPGQAAGSADTWETVDDVLSPPPPKTPPPPKEPPPKAKRTSASAEGASSSAEGACTGTNSS